MLVWIEKSTTANTYSRYKLLKIREFIKEKALLEQRNVKKYPLPIHSNCRFRILNQFRHNRNGMPPTGRQRKQFFKIIGIEIQKIHNSPIQYMAKAKEYCLWSIFPFYFHCRTHNGRQGKVFLFQENELNKELGSYRKQATLFFQVKQLLII